MDQIKKLTEVVTSQAQLLASMQQYLKTQEKILRTLLSSNEGVQERYNSHVQRMLNLQKELKGVEDDEPVPQPGDGPTE